MSFDGLSGETRRGEAPERPSIRGSVLLNLEEVEAMAVTQQAAVMLIDVT
jgi:hypothetical protein